MSIAVTTSLDRESWEKARKSGMKWNQLIKLGLNSLDKKDNLRELEELRENNKKLVSRVHSLAGRVLALETEDTEAE